MGGPPRRTASSAPPPRRQPLLAHQHGRGILTLRQWRGAGAGRLARGARTGRAAGRPPGRRRFLGLARRAQRAGEAPGDPIAEARPQPPASCGMLVRLAGTAYPPPHGGLLGSMASAEASCRTPRQCAWGPMRATLRPLQAL